MKDAVERLNAEYGLNLTDEEMEVIVRQAEAGQKLFKRLYETHVEGIVPAMKIDPAEKGGIHGTRRPYDHRSRA